MQALLLATGVIQGAALFAAGPQENDKPRASSRVQTAVRDGMTLRVRPVVVQAPPRLAQAPAPSGDAIALANQYRRKGYKLSDQLAREIYTAAVDNGIDPKIAFGLVRTESEFKDRATSRVGAIGLTQLMVPTARWFKKGATEADLRDSRTNLRIGFRYLNELRTRYKGDLELALLAYNRGSGTVDRVLERGGDPNNGYVEKVMGGGE
ncbi:MAG TPA: lytic transglycosylase domain-containing protein [Longimicrobium sp.]|nr:lytic transglycosylase domain-containing protein [Longimicrobium sp.]